MTNPTTRPPGAVGDERLRGALEEAKACGRSIIELLTVGRGAQARGIAIGLVRHCDWALADPPEQQERRCPTCNGERDKPFQQEHGRQLACPDDFHTAPEPQADSVEQEPEPPISESDDYRLGWLDGYRKAAEDRSYDDAHSPAEQERPDPERVVVSKDELRLALGPDEGSWSDAEAEANARLRAALSQTPDGSAQTGGEER